MALKLIQQGYKVAEVSKALGIARSSLYYKNKDRKRAKKQTDLSLLEKIKQIASEHPFWGYRRIWAYLKFRKGIRISQRKVYKLLKENGLFVPQRPKKARRKADKPKPQATRPKQFWGIDMTKFMLSGLGWCYLVIVLDWFTKKIVGYSVSMSCKTRQWLSAIHMALQNECPWGAREEDLSLISDNGSQPTSLSFMREMKILGIKQIFTSYDNPKGNADTERVMRTIKEDLLWLEEFESLTEAEEKIANWITWYNKQYLHSSLDYMSPEEFLKKWEVQEIKEQEALLCLA